jgi:outer membrane protein
MKKFFIVVLACLSLNVQAQTENPVTDAAPETTVIRFGYLSYDAALKAMPGYAVASQQIDNLRKAYEAELKRAEEDFNQKYEAFLEGQKDFPKTILLKRQTELQQLMKQNVEFKQQGRIDLARAEEEALAPLRTRLNEALATLAERYGFALIINTDGNACPFIDPKMGQDIQEEVQLLMNE